MKSFLIMVLFVMSGQLIFGQNTSKDTPKPLITVADIEIVFGKGFKEEPTTNYGDIVNYQFGNNDYSIQITIQPSYGMKSLKEYYKTMTPKGVTWQAIPEDPDGAMIEVRDDKSDDLASVPAIEYIRNGKHVRAQILGIYYGYDNKQMPKLRDEMRQKLAKLKRLP